MAKLKAWRQRKRAHLLAVEDPQQPGRDIGAGAFNILEVPFALRTSLFWSQHSLPACCCDGCLSM
jgi:hypothetical protein